MVSLTLFVAQYLMIFPLADFMLWRYLLGLNPKNIPAAFQIGKYYIILLLLCLVISWCIFLLICVHVHITQVGLSGLFYASDEINSILQKLRKVMLQ